MRRTFLTGVVLAGGLTLTAAPASAQALFGAEAAFGTETDFGIGGRAHFPLGTSAPLDVQPGFMLFFPDGPAEYWEINVNLWYHIRTGGGSNALPYVGGGLNIGHVSSDGDFDDTDVGLNLGGGVRFGFTNTIPFLEARVTVGGDEQLVIGGGVLFGG